MILSRRRIGWCEFSARRSEKAVVAMGQRCSQIVHRRAFPQLAKRECRGPHAAAVERYVRGSRRESAIRRRSSRYTARPACRQ
jgi:hypothetical protein